MISNTAQNTLNQMLVRAIKTSPLVSEAGSYEINPAASICQISASKMVVLTVSSYKFRLTFMIHFMPDEKTKTHFMPATNCGAADWNERAFMDAMRECGNICCGNLNRDLVRAFPHVGMSTPNIIDVQCAAFLGKLGAGYLVHSDVVILYGPKFQVSLCINAFDYLDFSLDFVEAEVTGELELF